MQNNLTETGGRDGGRAQTNTTTTKTKRHIAFERVGGNPSPSFPILALDPGTDKTALVIYNGKEILRHEILENEEMRSLLGEILPAFKGKVWCEVVKSYGMAVGASVFKTCQAIGRFEQISEENGHWFHEVGRLAVKTHLCKSARAKDANVRQALIDLVGEQGKKAAPGPTYGIKSHTWAALAVAVYGYDQQFLHNANTPGIQAAPCLESK